MERLDTGPRELAARRLRAIEALEGEQRVEAARKLREAVEQAEQVQRERSQAVAVFGQDTLVLSAEARAHYA